MNQSFPKLNYEKISRSEASMKRHGNRNTAVIIGGGVGPLAGVVLHEHIIRLNQGVHKDSDHLDVWHISSVKEMPDRTEFLLSGDGGSNPGKVMAENVLKVGNILAAKKQQWVAAVPCATFHASPIYQKFISGIEHKPYHLKTYSLIDSVGKYLAEEELLNKVGVLSTIGSSKDGLWSNGLQKHGVSVREPCEVSRLQVHEAIYSPKFGLKAIGPPTQAAEHIIVDACLELEQIGIAGIILGCTELPFLLNRLNKKFKGRVKFYDPLEILAAFIIKDTKG